MRAILTYHSIDDSGSPISVGRAQFRAHCAFLGSGRIRVVPLLALLDLPDDGDAVAITFDDGIGNVGREAAPVLEDHGLSATVFVVSDHVGGRNDWGGTRVPGIPDLPLMDWDDLGRLRERGHQIGAHTRTHPALPGLPGDRLEEELAGCARRIDERLGSRPPVFAYPYGAVDDRCAGAVRSHFAAACTTELRGLRGRDDPVRLPRLDMFYLRARGALERWGTAAFRSRLWVRAQGRRVRALLAPPAHAAGRVA